MRVEVVRMSEKKRWKVLRFLGYAIPILLVVYVLSIGPVAAVLCDSDGVIKNPEHDKMAAIFYSPLVSVLTSNSWSDTLLVKYMRYCIDHF